MNSDEVNWLFANNRGSGKCKALRAGSVPARKNPISRDGELRSGPELDELACRRKTGCVDFNGVHYDTAKDSSCHDALTGTDVIEVLATSPQR